MEFLVKPEILMSYIYGPTFGNAESRLFPFAAQCFNTGSMQKVVWPCSKNGRGTIAQDSIEVDTRAEESMRETKEKLDGRNKEGHEREEPARRPVER
jgi:hypothetical protein